MTAFVCQSRKSFRFSQKIEIELKFVQLSQEKIS